jgi:hypothetical protein
VLFLYFGALCSVQISAIKNLLFSCSLWNPTCKIQRSLVGPLYRPRICSSSSTIGLALALLGSSLILIHEVQPPSASVLTTGEAQKNAVCVSHLKRPPASEHLPNTIHAAQRHECIVLFDAITDHPTHCNPEEKLMLEDEMFVSSNAEASVLAS